ncbi:MAG: putative toxin-antitoxin system toxin component, PIN family [Anaerolineaceae bacterium]|nr:putative toxin-antitoxin system toxin component, PIN family [Anaerolineaceae bacterium]
MKYYAVIDTNVLVSALLKWNSVPGKIIELVFSGTITPILNDVILNEYKEVLSRSKFHLTEDIVDEITDSLDKAALYVDAEPIDIDLPDPKDRVFYEIVMEARNQEEAWLVTGNMKHFPRELFIVTPREMLDIIMNDYHDE